MAIVTAVDIAHPIMRRAAIQNYVAIIFIVSIPLIAYVAYNKGKLTRFLFGMSILVSLAFILQIASVELESMVGRVSKRVHRDTQKAYWDIQETHPYIIGEVEEDGELIVTEWSDSIDEAFEIANLYSTQKGVEYVVEDYTDPNNPIVYDLNRKVVEV